MKAKVVIGALVLAMGTWVMSSSTAYSTGAISKEVGKPCTECHTKAGTKDLNDKGKCYQEKKTLEGC